MHLEQINCQATRACERSLQRVGVYWPDKSLVLRPTYSAGHSPVAAGHLRHQKSSTYFSRPPVPSLHLTYWHGKITKHYSWDKALVFMAMIGSAVLIMLMAMIGTVVLIMLIAMIGSVVLIMLMAVIALAL